MLSTTITSGTNTNFPSVPGNNLCDTTNFNKADSKYFTLAWSLTS